MTARIFHFRGTEADSELPMIAHAYAACPDPSDDEDGDQGCPTTRRFARSAHGVDAAWPHGPEYADPFERFADSSFVEQDRDVQALSHKWAFRCVCAIGVYALVAVYMGWWK